LVCLAQLWFSQVAATLLGFDVEEARRAIVGDHRGAVVVEHPAQLVEMLWALFLTTST